MISDRAYYKYKNDRKEQDGFDVVDWLAAEKEIHKWIVAIGT
jgi:predicted acyl esterase